MTLDEIGVAPAVIAEFWPQGFHVDVQAAIADIARAEEELQRVCFPVARKATLSTFGLACDAAGPGVAIARTNFLLRPTEGTSACDAGVFRSAAFYLGRPVFPLGAAQNKMIGIGMDDSGLVFLLFEGEIRRLAPSLGEAITALAQGLRYIDRRWSTLPDDEA